MDSVVRFLFVLAAAIAMAAAQFPRVCMENATQPDAVCCPTPTGFDSPCGGQGRGSCEKIINPDVDFSPVYPELSQDDRLNWPHRFFSYSCSCQGNFMGFQCMECQFGFTGADCLTPRPKRIRRNIMGFSADELKQFRETMHQTKITPMPDYVVLNNIYDVDPISKPRFSSVTIYDYFVYVHAYAARQTILHLPDGDPVKCDNVTNVIPIYDFAHGGPSFLMWHRHYNLLLERYIQRMTGDDEFALPYWKWIGVGGNCEVCNNDIMGATNYSDPRGTLDRGSIFSTWNTICQNTSSPESFGCRICDVTKPGSPIQRVPNNPDHPEMASEADLAFVLSRPIFDSPPYNSNAPPSSFRACLEGSASQEGTIGQTGKIAVHAISHQFFTGHEASVPNSPNDPLFMIQHCYVDRILEEWIRRVRPHPSQIPTSGAPVGHNRFSPIVPFFPTTLIGWYLKDSRDFGYDYDDLIINVSEDDDVVPWILAGVLAGVVLLLVVALIVVMCTRLGGGKTKEETLLLRTSKSSAQPPSYSPF